MHAKNTEQEAIAVRCVPSSSVSKVIVKANTALINLAREHGLESEVASLIADQERKQAKLACLRAERGNDKQA